MIGNTQFITLKAAQAMLAAGEAEASANNWNVAITIVDIGANLIMFQKMDGTQMGSIDVSIGKARTAANFKRPTKDMEEMIAGGRTPFLAIDGIVPIQGGVPVIINDTVIGAVGVSGVTSAQDEQVAMAAVAVVEG
jgi:glc operon protein GlcG